MLFLMLSLSLFIVQNIGLKEFSRRFPGGVGETARMNMLSLPLGALCLIPFGGMKMLSGTGWLLALAFAVSYVLVSSLYLYALNIGPLSLSAMMSNMSLLVNVIVNMILWDEQLSLLNWVGLVCMIVVIVMISLGSKGGGGGVSFKWFLVALGTLLTNGMCGVSQKVYSMLDASANASAYSFWGFLMAGAFYAVIALVKKPAPMARALKPSFAGCTAAIGIGTVVANMLLLMSLATLPAVIAYPVLEGAIVALVALVSVLIYRERFTLRVGVSLVLCLAGIVLLNL